MTSRTTPSAVDTPTDKPADSPARQVTIPNGQNPDMRTPAAPASDQLDQSATPSPTERAWALAIRKAARAADDISDLSDFEYLQHAILARDNIPSALSRIRRMQALRKRYHVDNVDATEALRFLNLTMHGIHCSTGTTSSGHRVTVMDYSKLEPSKLVTEQDWRLFICGTLYYFDAVHCDLDAVRHGLIYAAKCRSVRWTNFSIEAERRMNSVYQSTYPVRIHQVVLLDAPKIVSAMIKIVTPFLSPRIRGAIVASTERDFAKSMAGSPEALPPDLGGTFTQSMYLDYMLARLDERARNIAHVRL